MPAVAPWLPPRRGDRLYREARPMNGHNELDEFARDLRAWLDGAREGMDPADRAHTNRLVRLLDEKDPTQATDLLVAMLCATVFPIPVLMSLGKNDELTEVGEFAREFHNWLGNSPEAIDACYENRLLAALAEPDLAWPYARFPLDEQHAAARARQRDIVLAMQSAAVMALGVPLIYVSGSKWVQHWGTRVHYLSVYEQRQMAAWRKRLSDEAKAAKKETATDDLARAFIRRFDKTGRLPTLEKMRLDANKDRLRKGDETNTAVTPISRRLAEDITKKAVKARALELDRDFLDDLRS